MAAAFGNQTLNLCKSSALDPPQALAAKSTPSKAAVFRGRGKKSEICGGAGRSSFLAPIKAMEASKTTTHVNGQAKPSRRDSPGDDCGGFSGILLYIPMPCQFLLFYFSLHRLGSKNWLFKIYSAI